jgi:hypothetical protein
MKLKNRIDLVPGDTVFLNHKRQKLLFKTLEFTLES